MNLTLEKSFRISDQSIVQMWFLPSRDLARSLATLWLKGSFGEILLDGDCHRHHWHLCEKKLELPAGSIITGLVVKLEEKCQGFFFLDALRVGTLKGFSPWKEPETQDGNITVTPELLNKESANKLTIKMSFLKHFPEESSFKLVSPVGWMLQSHDENERYFTRVAVRTPSRESVPHSLACSLSESTRWKTEALVHIASSLPQGTEIEWTINNLALSKGDNRICRNRSFRAYCKEGEEGKWLKLKNSVSIIFSNGTSSQFKLSLRAGDGQGDISGFISSLDEYGNVCTTDNQSLDVKVETQGKAETLQVSLDNGLKSFRLYSESIAVASLSLPHIKKLESNKLYCSDSEYKHYYGYLHAHSEISEDGRQSPITCYEYARDCAHLDFCALSDHFWAHEPSWKWESIQEVNARFLEEGKFITFNGYEWSSQDHGDRNVYFAGEHCPPCPVGPIESTPLELYEQLEDVKCIIIPHSPAFELRARGINWDYHHPRLERLVEIFSAHGSSEGNISGPFPLANSAMNPPDYHNSYRNALARGYKLGIIAGGDDHCRPNPEHTGITVVIAKNRTRAAIFEALYERRCYGTTGPEIVMEYKMNGRWMGSVSEFDTPAPNRHYEFRIVSVVPIKSVEWIKNGQCESLFRPDSDNATNFAYEWNDSSLLCQGEYSYIRCKRIDGAMAWSSPVWNNFKDNCPSNEH